MVTSMKRFRQKHFNSHLIISAPRLPIHPSKGAVNQTQWSREEESPGGRTGLGEAEGHGPL